MGKRQLSIQYFEHCLDLLGKAINFSLYLKKKITKQLGNKTDFCLF